MPELHLGPHRAPGLVDVLDRILDKGLVVAGDVKISLAEVELLTIRIRLIVCSIDKAQQIGLDWWRNDPYFGSPSQLSDGRLTVADVGPTPRRRTAARPGRPDGAANGRRRRRGGD